MPSGKENSFSQRDESITRKNPKKGTECLSWERMASPAPFFQEAFEILSCRTHECLTVDAARADANENDASHASLCRSRKEWFNPDLTLA
jgi:hypothetical protein